MENVQIHFGGDAGKMRPMHAVNNGPVYKFSEDQRITNIDAFRDADIPFARTHDASFNADYGGEHTIDVIAIFPDFSKDENDPASYDFCLTDEYLKVMVFAGVEPFYRLGSKIEHWPKKYGTLPPPDFKKWAAICEHIIAHYTEGWADGFHYNISYWEIWNEPDSNSKKQWSGTQEQFFDLYETTAKHLKARFPHLKIGGPAVTFPIKEWVNLFLKYCRDHNVPLDFFSWHVYTAQPRDIEKLEGETRKLLDSFGFAQTESILDEWNYVSGWFGDDWIYSLRTEKSLKGSSFIAGTIMLSQYQPVDMLMYYDARPCGMNGMFSTDFVCDRLKGYYPFWMFNRLYQLGTAVPVSCDDRDLFVCASKGEAGMAFMLTHFRDVKEGDAKEICVAYDGLDGKPYKLTYYLLDEAHDAAIYRTETVSGISGESYLTLPLFTTVLVTMEPLR